MVSVSNYSSSATALDSTGITVLASALATAFAIDPSNVNYISSSSSSSSSSTGQRSLSSSGSSSGSGSGSANHMVVVLAIFIPLSAYPQYTNYPMGLYNMKSTEAGTPQFKTALQNSMRSKADAANANPLTASQVVTSSSDVDYLASVNLQLVYYAPTQAPTQASYVQQAAGGSSGGGSSTTVQIAVSLVAFFMFVVIVVCIVFNYRRRKDAKDGNKALSKYSDSNSIGGSGDVDMDPLVNTDSIYGEAPNFSYDSASVAGSEASSRMHRKLRKNSHGNNGKLAANNSTSPTSNPHHPHPPGVLSAVLENEDWTAGNNKNNKELRTKFSEQYFMHSGFDKTESELIFTNPFHKSKTRSKDKLGHSNRSSQLGSSGMGSSKDSHSPNGQHNMSLNTINTEDMEDDWGLGDTQIVFDKKVNKTITF